MGESNIRFGNVAGNVHVGDGDQYTAGRDQNIVHGHQASGHILTSSDTEQIAAAIDTLKAQLGTLRLTDDERNNARHVVESLQASTEAGSADPVKAGEHLTRLASVLKDAGAVSSSSSTIVESIVKVAKLVAPYGATALALLA